MKRFVAFMAVLCLAVSSCTKQQVVPAYAREKPHSTLMQTPAVDSLELAPVGLDEGNEVID